MTEATLTLRAKRVGPAEHPLKGRPGVESSSKRSASNEGRFKRAAFEPFRKTLRSRGHNYFHDRAASIGLAWGDFPQCAKIV